MKKIGAVITTTEEIIIAFLLFASTILLFVNVIMRYVFSNSTTWAEEVIRYAIIWVTFLGGSVCVRNKLHVGIDIFVSNAPPRLRKCLNILAELSSSVFCILITIAGYRNTMLVVQTSQKSPALMMPMWIVYMVIPLGSFLMAVGFMVNAVKLATGKQREEKEPLDISTM